MPTWIQDILKNAQAADYEQLMFEDDLENLSLSADDSSDNFRAQMSSSYEFRPRQRGADESERIKCTIKSARDFMESDAFATIRNDKITVNGVREQLNIVCSTTQHHAVQLSEDKASIKGDVCSVDLILMASKAFPLSDIFERTLRSVVQARRNISSGYIGIGPSVHVCIAWLAHAAQCSVSELLPRGEVFPNADRYIQERLKQEELSTVPQSDRVDLAIFQICRVLELLSVFDLRSQSAVDRSILIYAICRLALDKSSCCTMQHRASIAIENILNASSLTRKATIVEFSTIFPLISDDIKNLQMCHEIVRQSNVDSSCCLSLFCSVLIHISERAECEPAALDSMSEKEFIESYFGVILDVLNDVMDVCGNDEKKKCGLMAMLDNSLQSFLYNLFTRDKNQPLVELLKRLECDLGVNVNPNAALTCRLLRNLVDRFNIQSNSRLVHSMSI